MIIKKMMLMKSMTAKWNFTFKQENTKNLNFFKLFCRNKMNTYSNVELNRIKNYFTDMVQKKMKKIIMH